MGLFRTSRSGLWAKIALNRSCGGFNLVNLTYPLIVVPTGRSAKNLICYHDQSSGFRDGRDSSGNVCKVCTVSARLNLAARKAGEGQLMTGFLPFELPHC